LVLGEHRSLAPAHDVLGSAHRVGRVHGQHLADDQPIEQHADGGEVLLDRRLGRRLLQHLDIGGDVHGLDIGQLTDAVLLDPAEEVAHGPVISDAGVLVADLGCKEFEEAPGCMVAGPSDQRRHGHRAPHSRQLDRRRSFDHRRHVAPHGLHGDTL